MVNKPCTYSLDGEHHYGPRRWKNVGEVIACRCGLKARDPKEVEAQLAVTAAEQRRQRDVSRALLKRLHETGEQPLLPL